MSILRRNEKLWLLFFATLTKADRRRREDEQQLFFPRHRANFDRGDGAFRKKT